MADQGITATFQGIPEAIVVVDSLATRVRKALAAEMKVVGKAIQSRIKSAMTSALRSRTGTLQRAVSLRTVTSSTRLRVWVGVSSRGKGFYGKFQEYGVAKAVDVKTKKQGIKSRVMNLRPHPFFGPATLGIRNQIQGALQEAVNRGTR